MINRQRCITILYMNDAINYIIIQAYWYLVKYIGPIYSILLLGILLNSLG